MENRNPVAGNAWRYNKRQIIPNKKIEPKQKHAKRVLDELMEY